MSKLHEAYKMPQIQRRFIVHEQLEHKDSSRCVADALSAEKISRSCTSCDGDAPIARGRATSVVTPVTPKIPAINSALFLGTGIASSLVREVGSCAVEPWVHD